MFFIIPDDLLHALKWRSEGGVFSVLQSTTSQFSVTTLKVWEATFIKVHQMQDKFTILEVMICLLSSTTLLGLGLYG